MNKNNSIPALKVKEDGKIWLITDCPEEPKKDDYEEYDDWSYAMRHYNLSLASAERIEIDNQDVAKNLLFKTHSPSEFISSLHGEKGYALKPGIYPIPDLKWEVEEVLSSGWIPSYNDPDNIGGHPNAEPMEVAVISLPESLPEKHDYKKIAENQLLKIKELNDKIEKLEREPDIVTLNGVANLIDSFEGHRLLRAARVIKFIMDGKRLRQ